MTEAARRAPDLLGPAWVLGLRQTAGRGRRGRTWHDPEGNFAATLVMQPDGPPAAAALRSFVAALALHDVLLDLTGRPEALALKWPNDVLLQGGKLAGILLESTGSGTRVAHLAIGIGVNLRQAPPAQPGALPPVSLRDAAGVEIAPEAFLNRLAPAFARREAQLQGGGFAPIRAAWLARAARLGGTLTARTGTAELTGTFEGLDDSGALVLSTSAGRQAISAAEVFF